MPLIDLQLPDGTWTWCHDWREGLPVWRWKCAPPCLLTRTQIHQRGRRLGRGQDPFGLIVWRRGRRTAALWRLDLTRPARSATPALLASVDAMEAARRTCRDCRQRRPYRMPATWRCWPCMELSGDYTTTAPKPAALIAA